MECLAVKEDAMSSAALSIETGTVYAMSLDGVTGGSGFFQDPNM
jgi:hypothetical protein